MKILITGGSGSIGRQVILQLVAAATNNEITAFDIGNPKNKRFYNRFKERIRVVYGDIRDAKAIEAVCKNMDVVLHLAAIIPPLADEQPELTHQVNVDGTRHLLHALEVHSPDAFFLYTSSVSIYGDRLQSHWINVGDPVRPSFGDEYAETKIAAEELVRTSRLRWCIFRLSAIMGINTHQISGLLFHMPLATPLEITTNIDAARAIVKALSHTSELNLGIFNLGGGANCRILYQDFLDRSFALAGLGDARFPVGAFAEKNFHCGYYQDGDALEAILHFRQDTLETYFARFEASVSPPQRLVTRLVRRWVKWYLLQQSEPYKAFKQKDEKAMARFFL